MSSTESHARPAAVAILAAGEGRRMRSARPKVLHEVGHAPLLHHALRAGLSLAPGRVAVVVGHGGEAVAAAAREVAPEAAICLQRERRGTGHAVLAAAEALAGHGGDLYVLFADTPFIRPETLARWRMHAGAGPISPSSASRARRPAAMAG